MPHGNGFLLMFWYSYFGSVITKGEKRSTLRSEERLSFRAASKIKNIKILTSFLGQLSTILCNLVVSVLKVTSFDLVDPDSHYDSA